MNKSTIRFRKLLSGRHNARTALLLSLAYRFSLMQMPRRRDPAMGTPHDGHRDIADRTRGLCDRPDRHCDRRRRDALGRRADRIRPAGLHDRSGRSVLVFAAPMLSSAFGVTAAVI